jgi:hypothetical protein
VFVVVVKVIALIVKHPMRYCHVVWAHEAGGLATRDILYVTFHGYLARHNRFAAEAPKAVQQQPGRGGQPYGLAGAISGVITIASASSGFDA